MTQLGRGVTTRLPQVRRYQLALASLPRFLSSSVHTQENQTDDVVNGKYDLIGPPRPVSKLRPVKFATSPDDSELAIRLRELRQETQKFNQDWWTDHNKQFKEGREEYIKNILETQYPGQTDKSTLTADEMSIFYREFMNKQWKNHLEYNKEWQKRNWSIIGLMARVKLQTLFKF
eukprot:TRINITY_DN976_c0_g1_i1.p1 TRINITY_DN976_c0_g1~~TRINITY_DN976_c0_g1_i1.p1  ORF type:complete len:175 (-),score=48.11 TRINITY_DN976_c0_g1_i1:23-547(-)